jgi:hypothetical protein
VAPGEARTEVLQEPPTDTATRGNVDPSSTTLPTAVQVVTERQVTAANDAELSPAGVDSAVSLHTPPLKVTTRAPDTTAPTPRHEVADRQVTSLTVASRGPGMVHGRAWPVQPDEGDDAADDDDRPAAAPAAGRAITAVGKRRAAPTVAARSSRPRRTEGPGDR